MVDIYYKNTPNKSTRIITITTNITALIGLFIVLMYKGLLFTGNYYYLIVFLIIQTLFNIKWTYAKVYISKSSIFWSSFIFFKRVIAFDKLEKIIISDNEPFSTIVLFKLKTSKLIQLKVKSKETLDVLNSLNKKIQSTHSSNYT